MQPPETTSFWRGRLPHWEIVDGTYFVTLRVAGCLPHAVCCELEQMLTDASEADYVERLRQYFSKLEKWLDHHHEVDWLIRRDVAAMLGSAFDAYAKQGVWRVHAYGIMPNHLHWFFTPGDRSMSRAVKGFKRFTAREANRLMGREGERFWQVEWFDHWSRGPIESDRIIHYIRNNPVKAGLVEKAEDWPYIK